MELSDLGSARCSDICMIQQKVGGIRYTVVVRKPQYLMGWFCCTNWRRPKTECTHSTQTHHLHILLIRYSQIPTLQIKRDALHINVTKWSNQKRIQPLSDAIKEDFGSFGCKAFDVIYFPRCYTQFGQSVELPMLSSYFTLHVLS